MSTTIQKPTIGRVVIFTAWRGTGEASGKVDEYPGIVVLALHADYGIVDIKTFGPNSMYDNKNVPYDANGAPMTWRYPPHSKDTLDVGESGCVIVTKTRIAEEDSIASRALARFLAEREHKLREHSEWLTTQCSKFEDANISNRETIKALNERVAELEKERDTLRADLARANDERVRANGYLLAGQKSEMAMKGQLADARARVAENETLRTRIDALKGALKEAALRNDNDGPCFCTVPIPEGTAHHLSCQHIRHVLANDGKVVTNG